VEVESNEVAAVPLIKRRSNGRTDEESSWHHCRFGRILLPEQKRYGSQDLQIILRSTLRRNGGRWLLRIRVVIFDATSLARAAMAATVWSAYLLLAKAYGDVDGRRLRHDQHDAE